MPPSHVGAEPLGPAGIGAQRHHEPQPGRVGGAQPAQIPSPESATQMTPGGASWAMRSSAAAKQGASLDAPGWPPVVDRDPGAGGRLQGLELAGDGAIGGPPLSHQRRAGIPAGEPHRGHVQVQPRQVGPAAGRRGQGELATHPLGHRGQRLQCPAEPVVVEEARWDAEQFGHRRRRRPAGHVIQRRRPAQPVGHQRGDHLPVGQHGPPAHRDRVVDQVDQAQPVQVVAHQQQRPDVAAGAGRRGVEPGERGRQLLQLARLLQLVLAAQGAQHLDGGPGRRRPDRPAPAAGTRSGGRP